MSTDTVITREQAVASLTLAFSIDPGVRWMFGDVDRYLRGFADLVEVAASPAFGAGTVDTAEAGAAVAAWVPPGSETDDEAWGRLFATHVDPARLDDVFTFGMQLGAHHPSEPHWYLAMLGTDPLRQGIGLGTALLRAGLERCDRDELPAYLESANPRNRALYERHGFEVLAEIQSADAPPVWPMLRRPAS